MTRSRRTAPRPATACSPSGPTSSSARAASSSSGRTPRDARSATMSARCSADGCRELIQRLRNQFVLARWLGEQAVGVIRRDLAEAWEAGRVPTRSRAADAAGSADAAQPAEPAAGGDRVVATEADDAEPTDAEPTDAEPNQVIEAPVVAAVSTLAATVPFEGYDTL